MTVRHLRSSRAGLFASLTAAGMALMLAVLVPDRSPASPAAAGPTTAATTRPTYDVPKLDGITADGDPADWAGRGLAIAVLNASPLPRLPAAEFDAQVRFGWTDHGLLVRFDVIDPGRRESVSDVNFDDGAAIEVGVTDARGKDGWRVRVSPGVDPQHPRMRTLWFDDRPPAMRATKLSGTIVARPTPTGYTVEAEFPWDLARLDARVGTEFGLDVRVNHADGDEGAHLSWSSGRSLPDAAGKPHARLSVAASPAVTAAADGIFERFRRTRISVAAVGGAVARVKVGTAVAAEVPMRADGRFATTQVTLPIPPVGQAMEPVTASVDGTPVGPVSLPNLPTARSDAVGRLAVVGWPSVFASPALPRVDFETPSAAEDVLGPYTVHTTYYDADFRPVTTADRPGRYGAVADILPASGKRFRRYVTLYRAPAEVRGVPFRLRAGVAFPPQLGVDPGVATDQPTATGAYVADAMRSNRWRDPSLAVLLAGLSDTPPAAADLPDRLGPTGRDLAWWYELRKRTGDRVPYKHLDHLPDGVTPGRYAGPKLPLLLFLHGSGQRGTNLTVVRDNGVPKVLRDDPNWAYRNRFVLVCPQCPADQWWNPLLLRDLLDEVAAKYPVDPDRVYLTGLSMGGYGTWQLAQWFPDRFAALAIVCGGGDPADVGRIKDVPTWVFHGRQDPTVRIENAYEMVSALRDVHGRVRFTVYPDWPHNAWEPAYDDPALYEWLLAQRREHPTQPPAMTAGTRPAAN